MPGSGQKLVTGMNTPLGKDISVAQAMQSPSDPAPSFALRLRADPNNGSPIYIGRRSAFEPFYANDSATFYSCRREDIVINDGSVSGLILYVDDSAPMDPAAQYATVVMAREVSASGKAQNDPTP